MSDIAAWDRPNQKSSKTADTVSRDEVDKAIAMINRAKADAPPGANDALDTMIDLFKKMANLGPNDMDKAFQAVLDPKVQAAARDPGKRRQ